MSDEFTHRRAGELTRVARRLRTVWNAHGTWLYPWVVLVGTVRPAFKIAVRRLEDPLPISPTTEGCEARELELDQIPILAASHPSTSAETMRRYLEQGARCFVWWIEGVPAHWRWETDREIYLPYLRATVSLAKGDLLTAEVFTDPRFRNRGLYTRASLCRLHRARENGYHRIIGLVGSWNRPVHGVMTSKTGFSFEGRVGVWLLGPWRRHFADGYVPFEMEPS